MIKRLQSVLFVFFSVIVLAQPGTKDTWVIKNDGFGKCAPIGTSAGAATFPQDDYDVKQLLDRRGEMFAFIEYGTNGTNTGWCSRGLFRFDEVADRWYRMTVGLPNGNNGGEIVTNHNDIFCLSGGRVYKMTTDYANYPTGWEKLSKAPHDPIRWDMYFSNACSPHNNTWERLGFHKTKKIEAIGDTIFVWIQADCSTAHKMLKFNINTGLWSEMDLPALPHEVNGHNQGIDNYVITERIGGQFQFFINYNWYGDNECYPWYVWVYDPGDNSWKNISRGVSWNNQTGTSNPNPTYDGGTPCPLHDPGETVNGWGPAGQIVTSWNRRGLYATSEMGIWQWEGSRWVWLGDNRENSALYPTSQGIFSRGRDRGIEMLVGGNYAQIGDGSIPYCKGGSYRLFHTPDDGETIFVFYENYSHNGTPNCTPALHHLYRLEVDPDKPARARNIHAEALTYLGGPGGNNDPVNVGVGAHYEIFAAGNYPSIDAKGKPYASNSFNGATSASPGKIIRVTTWADSIIGVVNMGNQIHDYEIQNFAPYKMVVSGDFGVSVLDSTGLNQLWNIPSSTFDGYSGQLSVDIDNQGYVSVMRSQAAYGNDNLGDAKVWLVDPNGTIITSRINVGGDYVNDITIKDQVVFVTGFNNDNLNGTGCGETRGLPVQSCFIRAYEQQSGTLVLKHRTFDFPGSVLNLDQADTRGYRINVGKDGKLYFLGEAAGGNSVFRWNGKNTIRLNGCTNPAERLVKFDNYNLPINTKAAHIAYYATIDPANGEVERGQYIIPRKTNGESNTFRVKQGYIHADLQGYVYVLGKSAARFKGRQIQHVNGMLVDDYDGGDINVMIVSPTYDYRTLWGTFSEDKGSGTFNGIGIRDNVIAAYGSVNKGKMFTGGTKVYGAGDCEREFRRAYAIHEDPFNLDMDNTNVDDDAYLAVWYQDVWNHSNCDTLEERRVPGDTVINPTAFTYRPDFSASKLSVCLGEDVVITNNSIGDSINHTWNFGDGASIPPGIQGTGPWTVSWNTTGRKTVRLDVLLKGNVQDYESKPFYIEVFDSTAVIENLRGPQLICPYATAFYEVDNIFDVDFNWSVPAGASIIRGQGTNKVLVQFGATPGTVSVNATTPCGPTNSLDIAVSMLPSSTDNIIIAVGDTTLSAGDQFLEDKINTLGYTPVIIKDSILDASHAQCAILVIISATADPALINFKMREVTTPVINTQFALFDEMAFTYSGAADRGSEASQSDLNIINNTHELGEPVPLGQRPVYNAAYTINWGRPSANAINIGHVVGDANKVSLWGYDVGAAMRGYNAPARRVGFFADDAGMADLSVDGDSLLERAICWCLYNCPTNVQVILDSANKDSVCSYDSIRIHFSKIGVFDTSNVFQAQISDASGNFSGAPVIGVQADTSMNFIDCQIPYGLPSGSYEIRILATSPSKISLSTHTIFIKSKPLKPGPIFGDSILCRGDSIKDYYINSVATATGYRWQTPLGTSITGAPITMPNDYVTDTAINVNFNFSTSNQIKVYALNECGLSDEPSRLQTRLSTLPPAAPDTISGRDTVCVAESADYTVSPVTAASGYEWIIPAGMTVVGGDTTSTNVTLDFSGLSDGDVDTIKVYSIGACGRSETYASLIITVDNAASVPSLGPITSVANDCSGSYTYSVTPILGATRYIWTLPSGATGSSTTNSIDVSYPSATTDTVKCQVETPCGISDPSVLPVNILASGNSVLIYVHDKTSVSAGDQAIENRLQFLGYNTEIKDPSDQPYLSTDILCYKLIIMSNTLDRNDDVEEFATVAVPIIANVGSDGGHRKQTFYQLGMTLQTNYGGTSYEAERSGDTTINIINNGHLITATFFTGPTGVYTSADELGWGRPNANASLLATLKNVNDAYTIFTYEMGVSMVGIAAAERRVGFFMDESSMTNANANGVELFDRAVCWAVRGNCPGAVLNSNFIDFSAVKMGDHSQLTWNFNTSDNSEGAFTILRSVDGENYKPLAEIQEDKSSYYSYNDYEINEGGLYYYKVQYSSNDNNLTTQVRRVLFDQNDNIDIYPNPAKGIFNIQAEPNAILDAWIVDPTGRRISIQNRVKGDFSQVDLSSLAQGVYLLQILTADQIITKQLILRK